MTFSRQGGIPQVPTAPQGEVIASYASYLDAQKAVDYLSDQQFPVQAVTIVGHDLKMVERVTGRLTYGKVAMAGLASGAWLGLFVGLLLMMFGGSGQGTAVIISAVIIGVGFGLLFSIIPYALSRGKRDFTSSSQIVASVYVVLCLGPDAGKARQLLGAARLGGTAVAPVVSSANQPGAQQFGQQTGAQVGQPLPVNQPEPASNPAPVSAPHPNFVDEDGRPKYGVRLSEPVEPAGPVPPSQPVEPVQPSDPPMPPTAPPTEPPTAPPTAPPSGPPSQFP